MMPRRRIGWLAAALGIALGLLLGARLPAFPLWGELEAGPHGVGFRSIFTRDLSRSSLRAEAGAPRGREMRLHLWYPAAALENPRFLRLEDYVFLNAQELQAAAPDAGQKAQARKDFLQESLDLGAPAGKLDALLRMETASVLDAAPAAGRFPLVVFAHATPVTASVMSEYLASHGFVVVALTSKGTFARDYYHDVPDLETLITDLAFAAGTAKALDFVDGERVGAIGMSAGSIAALGLHVRNPDVRAVVSLDGTIGEEKGSFLVTRNPYYDVSRIQAPLLHLYSPDNPYLDLSRLRSWRYSRRTLVRLSRMRHVDYLAYGMFEHFVPGLLGPAPAPGDAKTGFEWVCRYVLRFLQAHLLEAADSRAFLAEAPEAHGVPAGLMTLEEHPGVPPALTVAEVRRVLDQEGFARLAALYRQRKAADPQPIPRGAFLQIGKGLLSGKRYALARDVFGLFVDSFPDAAEAHDYMASAALGLGDPALARTHFEQVLRCVDADPDLDFRTRRLLEATARQALARKEAP